MESKFFTPKNLRALTTFVVAVSSASSFAMTQELFKVHLYQGTQEVTIPKMFEEPAPLVLTTDNMGTIEKADFMSFTMPVKKIMAGRAKLTKAILKLGSVEGKQFNADSGGILNIEYLQHWALVKSTYATTDIFLSRHGTQWAAFAKDARSGQWKEIKEVRAQLNITSDDMIVGVASLDFVVDSASSTVSSGRAEESRGSRSETASRERDVRTDRIANTRPVIEASECQADGHSGNYVSMIIKAKDQSAKLWFDAYGSQASHKCSELRDRLSKIRNESRQVACSCYSGLVNSNWNYMNCYSIYPSSGDVIQIKWNEYHYGAEACWQAAAEAERSE